MNAEAGNHRAARAGQGGEIFRIDLVAELLQGTARTRAHGHASGDRGTAQLRQQRLIAQERVGFFGIGLRPQAMASHEPRLVARVPVTAGAADRWNGMDRAGRQAPSGLYFARIEGAPAGTSGKFLLLH